MPAQQPLAAADSAVVRRLKNVIRLTSPELAARRATLDAAEARLRAAGFAPPAALSAEVEGVPSGLDLAGAQSLRLDVSREILPGEQLGPLIASRVKDENVKITAQRAAWLGNDQTHYERKWTDHDIDDLKRLIQLTVNWLHNIELTKAAVAAMPKGKK